MAYQIGQIRFTGSGCVSTVNSTISYQQVSMGDSTSGATSTSFQDVLITPDNAFVKNRDYYLSISIPQDMNYDMNFNLKIIKKENNTTQVYQYLKNITINRGGSGENVYSVALYEKSDGNVAAMIPLPYRSGELNTKDYIYYNSTNDAYYLGNGGTSYTRTYNFNDLSVVASWRQETGENYGVFEMIFRPVEDSFEGILLEMVRTAEDYNIQRSSPDGTTEYGRKVDINKVKYTLYELSNLVDQMNRDRTLSRIGVWGHSGLIMSVNGEEIRIGPSGYYELDAVPVESIGIVARDWNDNWTIDYEYDNDAEAQTTAAEGSE